ncbi:serine hydrolase domain-containing protein [Nonomuraea jiangxiensis]|uniref:CubicO group peptidase, beta-lactamase class C family n=1 Tax=Nonomuraea jiangxiensis TaxID=633440 RepID=A0A1G9DAE8_9ACTN|nr:serine hydrolase domain-containing protein [Nonomuraea jiangxiensis]SDK60896.1 CubicO group peptidase, beta-lactamase class C family [Nonomuraea jiangxiensis]
MSDITRTQARVSELLAEYRIPGAAVGIYHDGEIIDFAVGVKNVETREPATADTIYQCGSMTKTWTALAFMQLVDEGKADLDEPVRTCLPGFRVADPEVSANLTPRHLLHHTNGIEEAYGDPGQDDDVYERMVANIAGAPQVHPLGRTHGYSAALGYAVLARVMEVINGKRWDDIMRDRLFDPLELTGTTTWHALVDPQRAATGHLIRSLDEGPVVSPLTHLPRSFGPGGNISSTARDVLTMAHVFLDGGKAPNGTRIVSAEAVREMMESRVPVPDPHLFGPEWGLGLIVCDWHGETVYAHDGSTVGQSARLRILPDSGLALVLLTNAGPRDGFYRRVFNEILSDLGAPTIPDLPEPDPTLPLDPSRYEGVYERPGARYAVSAEDGDLRLTLTVNPVEAQLTGKPERITYELLPISETHFLMPAASPLEDPQTVAIYDFHQGVAQYLHTNCRVNPRASEENTGMHVMAVSTISDNGRFWDALKAAHGHLPKGATWTLAVAGTDGTKAVNVIVHDSVDSVKTFFEEHAGPFATTEYFEADAANAVGLPKT